MTIDDLHTQMTIGFKAVADEFKAVRGEMATEFAAVRTEMAVEFRAVRTEMSAEFTAVRAEMKTQAEGLDARIKAEGETTRRHFDIVAEQFKEFTKALADGIGLNTERLDDHETRISALETGRS